MKENNKTNTRLLSTSSIIGLSLSFPVTGFIYGVYFCENYGQGFSGLVMRILLGFVESILTTITLGAPWDNEGGTSSTNLRFYVFLTFITITLTAFLIQKRMKNNAKVN